MKITITEEIKLAKAGIYKITFDNGYFYIGSSKDLQSRIYKHTKYFESNFTSPPTCKTLIKMKGFTGHAIFSLIEEMEAVKGRYWNRPDKLVQKENAYISQHKLNKMMLNDSRRCGSSEMMSACIDKGLYKRLKELALANNIGISEMTENILQSYFDSLI